ncbi:hypothetical protein BASA81_002990 [Batrachochytrium salamandrivorans]|nr:hypothetical protein BASA81_002990 [Batrachochytrium salamandrivorans]
MCANVGQKGASALAEALQCPRNKVTYLNLLHNVIGIEGVQLLSTAVLHGDCKARNVESDSRALDAVIQDLTTYRNLLTLLSARQVSRLSRTAAIKRLPSDLIRLVAGMVRVGARDGEGEQFVDEEEEEEYEEYEEEG